MQLCKKRDQTARTFRKLSTKCAYMNGNYIGVGGRKKNSPFIRIYWRISYSPTENRIFVRCGPVTIIFYIYKYLLIIIIHISYSTRYFNLSFFLFPLSISDSKKDIKMKLVFFSLRVYPTIFIILIIAFVVTRNTPYICIADNQGLQHSCI